MTEFTCAFCKEVPVEEDNMICDDCAKKEIEAEERDEANAQHYYERQRIRYAGIGLFDNEVGKVSVTYRRKVLRTWNYSVLGLMLHEQGRADALLEAKGYIEGWCDAIATIRP